MSSLIDGLSAWQRIDAALAKFAPTVARSLRPPLSVDDPLRAWLEAADDGHNGLRSAYETHDGAKSAGGVLSLLPQPSGANFTRITTWLSLHAAREEQSRLASALGEREAQSLFPLARVGTYSLSSAIGYDAEDQRVLTVELSSGMLTAVTYNEELHTNHRAAVGVTWCAYLEEVARVLATGELEDFRDEYRVLRLTPRHPKSRTNR